MPEFVDLLPAIAQMTDPRDRWPLADVSASAHLSTSRAQRVLTSAMGESPTQYQRRIGLDFGAAMLSSTDARIVDIALATGFGCHEAFTRAFTTRFGSSPRRWRADHARIEPTDARRSLTTSRCVGIYRRPLTRSSSTMSPPIEIRTLEPTPMLCMSRRVDRESVANALAEILPAVFGYAVENGLAMSGPPFVRYTDMSPAFFSLEAGVPLSETPAAPAADSGIMLGELPGGEAACAEHVGPYDTLGDTHQAVERWIDGESRTPAGGPWEVYITDPAEVPDPAAWVTELYWPLAA